MKHCPPTSGSGGSSGHRGGTLALVGSNEKVTVHFSTFSVISHPAERLWMDKSSQATPSVLLTPSEVKQTSKDGFNWECGTRTSAPSEC